MAATAWKPERPAERVNDHVLMSRGGDVVSQSGRPYDLVGDAEPLFGPDLQVKWDGSFVVWLSPDEHPGNWMRTTPQSCHVRIRVFHGDWEREAPMTARIERVGRRARRR